MRTTDRWGNAVTDAEIRSQWARREWRYTYSVRMIDTGGNWVSSTNWQIYNIPLAAVIPGASTRAGIDQTSADLTLTLLADYLPAGVVPLRGYRLEIDEVYGAWPNHHPWFTGIILDVTVKDALVGKTLQRVYEVHLGGMAQRLRGYQVSTLSMTPVTWWDAATYGPHIATVIVRESRGTLLATGASSTQLLPDCPSPWGALSAVAVLSTHSDYTLPLAYTTAYTLTEVDATLHTTPLTIHWTADASVPVAGTVVYYKVWNVELLGVSRFGRLLTPGWSFVMPYGRYHYDLFETTIAVYDTSGGMYRITPADPTSYKSTAGLLNPTGAVEYLALTNSSGVDAVVQISSVSAAGVITLAGAPTWAPAYVPQVGDAIRVCTTEMNPAWDERGVPSALVSTPPPVAFNRSYEHARVWEDPSATCAAINSSVTTFAVTGTLVVGTTILIDHEQMYVSNFVAPNVTVTRGYNQTTARSHALNAPILQEYPRTAWQLRSNLGFAVPAGRRYWNHTYLMVAPYLGPMDGSTADPNRFEQGLKTLLTTVLGLYAAADISTAVTGAWLKQFTRTNVDLADLLDEMVKNCLPPNGRVFDTPDGRLQVASLAQKTTPDWEIWDPQEVTETLADAPITATTILASDLEPQNQAPRWRTAVSGWTAGTEGYLTDGRHDQAAVQAAAAAHAYVSFTMRGGIHPAKNFPPIAEIRVYGSGVLSVEAVPTLEDGSTLAYWLPGHTHVTLPGATTAYKIDADALSRAISFLPWYQSFQLVFWFQGLNDNPGSATVAQCSEIEIDVRVNAAATAYLTDNPALCVVPTDTSQFGSVWTWDAANRTAALYAPSSFLKRVQPYYDTSGSYAHVPRYQVVELQGISPDQARAYSQNWQAEAVRFVNGYVIKAASHPLAEIGDTFAVNLNNGRTFLDGTTRKVLLLRDMSKTFSESNPIAEYRGLNYSL